MIQIIVLFLFLLFTWQSLQGQTIENWKIYFDSAGALVGKFDYKAALKLGKKGLDLAHSDSVRSLSYRQLGEIGLGLSDYDQSLVWLVADSVLTAKAFGLNDLRYAEAVYNVGTIYHWKGKLALAIRYYRQAVDLKGKIAGKNSITYAVSLVDLANGLEQTKELVAAENALNEALAIFNAQLDTSSESYLACIQNLAQIYRNQSRYALAESMLLKIANQLKAKNGGLSEPYAAFCNEMANLYYLVGRYPDSEVYYRQSMDIRKKIFGEQYIEYLFVMGNLANTLLNLGRTDEAEAYAKQVVNSLQKIDSLHPILDWALNILVSVLSDKKELIKAKLVQEEGLRLAKLLGKDSVTETAKAHITYAIILRQLGYLKAALANYEKANAIYYKLFGPEHHYVIINQRNIANGYIFRQEFGKSDSIMNRYLSICARVLGKEHLTTIGFVGLKASLMERVQNYVAADSLYQIELDGYLSLIDRFFVVFSEKQRAQFWQNCEEEFYYFYNYCVKRYHSFKPITGICYNYLLNTKGILLNANNKLRQQITNSNDSLVKKNFEQWQQTLEKTSKLLQETRTNKQQKENFDQLLDSLEKRTQQLEKELSMQTAAFSKRIEKKKKDWRTVQAALKPGEAALEMVRIQTRGYLKMLIDSSDEKLPAYPLYGITDTVGYAALIIYPGATYPELIWLLNGAELETKYLRLYRSMISKQSKDSILYDKYWGSIDSFLQKKRIKKVWFSPDGVYHQINLNTLWEPIRQLFLIDKYEIRILNSTRDLNSQVSFGANRKAVLTGNPVFKLTNRVLDSLIAIKNNNKTAVPTMGWITMSGIERADLLTALPGTAKEIASLNIFFNKTNRWQVTNWTGLDALEENIKSVQSPEVLHIATHGFFSPKHTGNSKASKLIDAPLFRSGLMLTGAGNTLGMTEKDKNASGAVLSSMLEDGILTAFEVQSLNLDSTRLVVLSACETGLGEIVQGEGVYGLQRAFQVAGAQQLIMSLWKVNDETTQLLMTTFYQEWLKGKDISAAFTAAQLIVRKKYVHPYYWGPFILIGK